MRSDVPLVGGQWIPRAGVLVWQPNPKPQMSTTNRKVDVHDLVACPTCLARVDEGCHTASGRQRWPHRTRLVSRLCSCGSTLPTGAVACGPCLRKPLERTA